MEGLVRSSKELSLCGNILEKYVQYSMLVFPLKLIRNIIVMKIIRTQWFPTHGMDV